MQKTQKIGKIALQNALKERLSLLTTGLKEAEMGAKGIELVKEMKELHAMLESILGEKNSKKEAHTHMVFSWADPTDAHADSKVKTVHNTASEQVKNNKES